MTTEPRPRFLLVTTVKNEGPHILEWVAHHRLVGFTDIVIYQNDSTDLTDKILQELQNIGAIQYFDNIFRPDWPNKRYQMRSYRRVSTLPAYQDCEWCMALDGDEFLVIKTPEANLPSLIAQYPDNIDEIRINWRNFGNAGFKKFSPRLTTVRFTRSSDERYVTENLVSFKTLFKTKSFVRPGAHRPQFPQIDAPKVANGSGLLAPEFDEDDWRCTDPKALKYAQVNHYQLKDCESFLLKSARGDALRAQQVRKLNYWNNFNHNQVENLSLHQRAKAIRAEMMRLDELSGGKLIQLRRRSIDKSRAEIEHLKGIPEYRRLFRQIKRASDGGQ